MQCNYGLLPPRKLANTHPEPFLFSMSVLRSHTFNADVKQVFHRRLDLVLGGDWVYLEGVGVVAGALVRTLLGHERAENNLIRPQVETRFAMHARLSASQFANVGLRVWS